MSTSQVWKGNSQPRKGYPPSRIPPRCRRLRKRNPSTLRLGGCDTRLGMPHTCGNARSTPGSAPSLARQDRCSPSISAPSVRQGNSGCRSRIRASRPGPPNSLHITLVIDPQILIQRLRRRTFLQLFERGQAAPLAAGTAPGVHRKCIDKAGFRVYQPPTGRLGRVDAPMAPNRRILATWRPESASRI